MNEYKNLKIWGYNHNDEDPNEEYKRRYNSPSTIKTGLIINPMLKGTRLSKRFELFAVLTRDLFLLEEKVNRNSQKIRHLRANLPRIASQQLFNHTLINEIFSTNDIEDVKTTKKEVAEAISSIEEDKRSDRFDSFVRMYKDIDDEKKLNIQTPKDIRVAYDKLLEGEIASKDLPDGKIFRNSKVRIGTSLKTIHMPKSTEALFMPDIESWIKFINDDSIPELIKAFIAHYYFENIHPFNDGNGRLGRYILCSYLGTKLDPLTAITFSSEINSNREKYYKSFEDVEDPKNYGEITFFINEMLTLLLNGQEKLLLHLYDQDEILKKVSKFLDESDFDNIEKACLFIYTQVYLFNDFASAIKDSDLIKLLYDERHFSKSSIKKSIRVLAKDGMIKIVKERPLIRELAEKFINLVDTQVY